MIHFGQRGHSVPTCMPPSIVKEAAHTDLDKTCTQKLAGVDSWDRRYVCSSVAKEAEGTWREAS